jgi:hypothetical protein
VPKSGIIGQLGQFGAMMERSKPWQWEQMWRMAEVYCNWSRMMACVPQNIRKWFLSKLRVESQRVTNYTKLSEIEHKSTDAETNVKSRFRKVNLLMKLTNRQVGIWDQAWPVCLWQSHATCWEKHDRKVWTDWSFWNECWTTWHECHETTKDSILLGRK